jgi:hypothetical protein
LPLIYDKPSCLESGIAESPDLGASRIAESSFMGMPGHGGHWNLQGPE